MAKTQTSVATAVETKQDDEKPGFTLQDAAQKIQEAVQKNMEDGLAEIESILRNRGLKFDHEMVLNSRGHSFRTQLVPAN